MSMPSKEQWAEFEERADRLYCTQKLTCDGFELSVTKAQISKNKLGVVVYVNGWIKGEWLGGEKADCAEQRFMRPVERYAYRPKFRQEMLKLMGKRRYAQEGMDRKVKYFMPDWPSGAALRRHLAKTCKAITIHPDPILDDVEAKAAALVADMKETLG